MKTGPVSPVLQEAQSNSAECLPRNSWKRANRGGAYITRLFLHGAASKWAASAGSGNFLTEEKRGDRARGTTMATIPDHLLSWLDRVAEVAQEAVDQYDISLSKPDDQRESKRLFVTIRDLRKVLEERKRSS